MKDAKLNLKKQKQITKDTKEESSNQELKEKKSTNT